MHTAKVLPIKPHEQEVQLQDLGVSVNFPDEVILVFNDLIKENLKPTIFGIEKALVPRKLVVDRLEALGFTKEELSEKEWLDITDLYERFGWDVEVVGIGPNEGVLAIYVFTEHKEAKKA